jgi:hypothetical protein
MKIPRVVYGLAKKRAELVAELAHREGRHDYCRQGIAAIDAVLPLWEAGKNPPVYKRQHKSRPALVPRLVRKIVNALREAGGPLTTAQIVDAVSVGMELSQEDRRRLIVTVSDRLKELRSEGRVMATMGPKHRNLWRLVDCQRSTASVNSKYPSKY